MLINKEDFRKALGQFATGVTVITVAAGEGHVHGMTANAFTSVSLEPMLVLVCVADEARTRPLIEARKRFGVNVLAEDQQALAHYYAHAAEDHESAHGLGARFRHTEHGTPLLEGCLARLECRVVSVHQEGDHSVFVAAVEQAEVRQGRPLLFYSGCYRRLAPEESAQQG